MTVSRVAKFIVAGIGAAALALQVAITDDKVTANEAVSIVIAALTAVGVFAVPNTRVPPEL